MEKNWLIRTRSHKILGPISKMKVVEFLEKGSLSAEDEVTSGNGYWFKIKESDEVNKYLRGDIPQTFNPISEATNVLTATNPNRETTASFKPSGLPKDIVEKSEELKLTPSNDDLEYPDMDSVSPSSDDLEYPAMDVQAPGSGDLEYPEAQESSDHSGALPSQGDLEYPDMGDIGNIALDVAPSESVQEVKVEVSSIPSHTQLDTAHVGSSDEEGIYPSAQDLEYPVMPGEEPVKTMSEDATGEFEMPVDSPVDNDQTDPSFQFEAAPLEELQSEQAEEAPVEEAPVEEPASKVPEDLSLDESDSNLSVEETPRVEIEEVEELEEEFEEERPKKKARKKISTKKKKKKSSGRNDVVFLVLLLALVFMAFYGVFYYWTKILNKDIPFISSVQAQEITSPLIKKKA